MTKSHLYGGRRRKTVKKGGDGAAEHAIKVYGTGGQQYADTSRGNLIATINGGSKKGGSALTSIAVPAVLIAANQLYNPKGRKTLKKYNKLMSGGEGATDTSAAVMNAIKSAGATNDMLTQQITAGNTPPPAIVDNASAAPNADYYTGQGVPVSSGGGKKKNGGSVITDIAVPAVLITANQLYRSKRPIKSLNTRRRKYSNKKR